MAEGRKATRGALDPYETSEDHMKRLLVQVVGSTANAIWGIWTATVVGIAG